MQGTGNDMDSPAQALFEVEFLEDTMIVTPNRNLSEFEYDHIEEEARRLLKLWETTDVKNVIVDFYRTDYCGSTALGLLVKLWNHVQSRKGVAPSGAPSGPRPPA